ncbi:FtsX-like permease family protein [Trebonia kvetii]|uniref:FtsX-like permease family protein n=1 Tax=Trebonia kvetii TaxID=2480626 RepID=A0A6P2C904_9ACTN|nr:FtsX-like permease family protein [Trebonia kvetii]TVZ06836.1 FtsX-like permease family protein [Trebonia kvetii]
MLRLGFQLTLHSGREALVRLLITAAAVAVGVALLLGVLAEYHAFQSSANKRCWSCTQGSYVPSTLPAHGELWNNSVDFYQGQTISRLDVAALGPDAPVPPGITHLPPAGEYYASPALAALIGSVPAGQLGARFPGTMTGTIGQAGLHGAGDLAIYIGHTPAQVNSIPGTTWVTSVNSAPEQAVFTPFFRYAFAIGVLAVLFPMLVLISTATRLAAGRREERFAALRLVGGTPGDIRTIAAIESVIGAFLGAVLGTGIFLLVRPALAGTALIGTQYFESDLTPTAASYGAMLVGVPVAAAIAALLSLRRVQISPLGVTRRATPKPPGWWRLLALVIGVGVFVYGLSKTSRESIGAPAYPGLLLTMIGIVIAGPWLTAQSARLFGRAARGSSALLATRRLADNPKGAFRAVTGLVLAVFLGTMVGVFVPAMNALQSPPSAGALSDILTGQVGLPAAAGQRLIGGLRTIPGAGVYPLYDLTGGGEPRMVAVSCADLRAIRGLGQCAPGLRAVQVQDDSIFDDNPRFGDRTIADSSSPAYTGNPAALPLQTVLVKVNSPATLERVRTYLAVHAPPQVGGDAQNLPTPPRTFGETLQIRAERLTTFEKILYAAVALTLIVAGCSLAVSIGGSLVDRKRPFTLLRVSGTQAGVLARVVLIEAAVPLVAATVVAAGVAYGTAVTAVMRLTPAGTGVPLLGRDYYTIMGIGLAIAFGVITLTLPLLRRMTAPAAIRFE